MFHPITAVLRTFASCVLLGLPLWGLTQASSLEEYEKFAEFSEQYLSPTADDSIRVVNFWATWCSPCVKELPYFDALTESLSAEDKTQVVLVTIDLKSMHASSLMPFLEKTNLVSKVVALTDGSTNDWIDLVDPSWSGAIPITVLIKGDKRAFYEKDYHSLEELQADINAL